MGRYDFYSTCFQVNKWAAITLSLFITSSCPIKIYIDPPYPKEWILFFITMYTYSNILNCTFQKQLCQAIYGSFWILLLEMIYSFRRPKVLVITILKNPITFWYPNAFSNSFSLKVRKTNYKYEGCCQSFSKNMEFYLFSAFFSCFLTDFLKFLWLFPILLIFKFSYYVHNHRIQVMFTCNKNLFWS